MPCVTESSESVTIGSTFAFGAIPTNPVPRPWATIRLAMPLPCPGTGAVSVSVRPSPPPPVASVPGRTAPANSGSSAWTPVSRTATVTPSPWATGQILVSTAHEANHHSWGSGLGVASAATGILTTSRKAIAVPLTIVLSQRIDPLVVRHQVTRGTGRTRPNETMPVAGYRLVTAWFMQGRTGLGTLVEVGDGRLAPALAPPAARPDHRAAHRGATVSTKSMPGAAGGPAKPLFTGEG